MGGAPPHQTTRCKSLSNNRTVCLIHLLGRLGPSTSIFPFDSQTVQVQQLLEQVVDQDGVFSDPTVTHSLVDIVRKEGAKNLSLRPVGELYTERGVSSLSSLLYYSI